MTTASGIEIEGTTCCPGGEGTTLSWQRSQQLRRLRGQARLAHADLLESAEFNDYLLRFNHSVRFARLGWQGDAIALQVVVPIDDRYWLAIAGETLVHVSRLLRPQVAWWDQPRALVEDLFQQARRGRREALKRRLLWRPL
jgi:hypothetical protein